MQRDEICARQQIVQVNLFDAHFVRLFLAEERIIGQDLHFEAAGTVAHDAADIACADHTKRFVGQLNPHELGLFPFPGVGRGRGLGDLTGDCKHHCYGMFGRCDHVAKRGVHDDHTFFGGSFTVDIVDADPCAPDDFEIVSLCQNGRGDFGGRTDRKTVVIADDLGKLFFVFANIGHEIDIDPAVAEDLNCCFAQLVRNEYFGHWVFLVASRGMVLRA